MSEDAQKFDNNVSGGFHFRKSNDDILDGAKDNRAVFDISPTAEENKSVENIEKVGSRLCKSPLRRSHSDAGDDEISHAENEVRGDTKSHLPKSQKSPILRRRQTALDNAFHNILQEGKEFLHRKRQNVPILRAHFGQNKSQNSPNMDQKKAMAEPTISSSNSIRYRREQDDVKLETPNTATIGDDVASQMQPSKSTSPTEKMAVQSTPNSNQAKATKDTALEHSKNVFVPDESKLPRWRVDERKDPAADAISFPKIPDSLSNIFFDYYKEIIGVVLLAATVVRFTSDFRVVPSFLFGLIWGVYLTFLAALVVFKFCLPPERYPSISKIEEKPVTSPESAAQEIAAIDKQLMTEDLIVYKGWMNRLHGKYDPFTYHISSTNTVLVRLDRSTLRISIPKQNLNRHTYYQEPHAMPALASQQLFDITGASVVLRPKHLARRRWWSRKYPITIIFPPTDDQKKLQAKEIKMSPIVGGKSGKKKHGSDEVLKKGELPCDVNIVLKESEPLANEKPPDQQSRRESFREDEENDGDVEELYDDTDDENEHFPLHATTSLPADLNAAVTTPEGSQAKGTRRLRKRRIIYLFTRSSREKEHWFYVLRRAACHYSYIQERQKFYKTRLERSSSTQLLPTAAADTEDLRVTSEGRYKDEPLTMEWMLYMSMQKQFDKHMEAYLKDKKNNPKPETQAMDMLGLSWKDWPADSILCTPLIANEKVDPSLSSHLTIDWANALCSRVFYDFSRNPAWMNTVHERIQRKLATVHLPYFIETLRLTQLEPGNVSPKIISVNAPSMNEWGLWLDARLQYVGGLRLVLETKVNLMKLKEDAEPAASKGPTVKQSGFYYSDEAVPESPESSPDEDAPVLIAQGKPVQDAPKEGRGKRISHFIGKIAQSKYFQAATDNKYVKKLMQGVSDTPLILEVEAMYLDGPLVINIPPPPSDRLWYGFRFPPKVVLKARPRVGERTVNLSHITDWIESKLLMLLEKNLVVPNLDDLIIPVLGGSPIVKNFL